MDDWVSWLQTNDNLSGWAQFFGSMLALLLTYFTAFAPNWQRRRKLKRAANRLLQNGFEAIESFHRTSAHYLPTQISLRTAGLSMTGVANEIDRFPIYELADQGPRSTARHLVAVSGQLRLLDLALEHFAEELEGKNPTSEDQNMIRDFVGQQLDLVGKMITGAEIKRPDPSDFDLE